MTVGELIEALKKCPADYEVRVHGDGGKVTRVYEECVERDSVVGGEYVAIETDG